MVGLITDLLGQVPVNDGMPTWLQAKKAQAVDQLAQLGDPDRKSENWRYTDSKRLHVTDGIVLSQSESIAIDADHEKVVIRIHDNGFEVSANCPGSIQVKAINEIAEADWKDLAFNQETVANLLNTAAFNHGVTVSLTDCWDNESYHLVIEYDFDENNHWQYVRNQVNINQKQHLSLVENMKSGQVNIVNVFSVKAEGQLMRHQSVALEKNQRCISFNHFDLADNTSAKSTNQHFGGLLQHHMHQVSFNGTHAEFKMGTVNKGFDNSNIADLVQVDHNFENNQSDVTHRSIADDQSQIFTNAKAYVAIGADQSEIEQDLKNILLSPDAKIYSKPELEVYADEVVAAHGSTIGALDEQSLFYLQSRGIDIKQARAIMIESFEQEAMSC